jgi:enolase
MKIKRVHASQIFDSRGFPTVECCITLEDGSCVTASVPSGASVGKHEALELRDGDQHLFSGQGVLKAISRIEKIIAPLLVGKEPDIQAVDALLLELDGTAHKSKLGANATLAVSSALTRAQARVADCELFELINNVYGFGFLTLPICMFNIINGGMHASNDIVFQEFMVSPLQASSMEEVMEQIFLIYQKLKSLLRRDGYLTTVGDEGGFAPVFAEQGFDKELIALDYILEAITQSGFNVTHFGLCLDVAASHFYDDQTQLYALDGVNIDCDQLLDFYEKLVVDYSIHSLEDGMAEDDIEGWRLLTQRLGDKIMLVGDDIFVTDTERIHNGITHKIANSVLIKPNQCGTISETVQAIKTARHASYKTVVSHRSGETNDDFISDFVIGTCTPYFKAGAPARGERVAKYNRLLKIAKILSR